MGWGQSKKLIYLAEAIDATQALRIGLVDEIVPGDRFEAELQRLADTILAGSPFTLRHTKEMLRGLGHGSAPHETSDSLALFVAATQGDDFREGVAAFFAKRPPHFRRSPPR